MVRPLRIQYENAFYHVMNRGRGRQFIFHGQSYYEAYLECLGQAHKRFGLEVHAYCLLGNHYHLLLKTPRGNLSRAMRHIDGVYTQHYNRLKRTDGSLFRGRYKAILIDSSSYLLQVSRYIHRNPIELPSPLVSQLEQYPWSSYPAYVRAAKPPEWLYLEEIQGELASPHPFAAYKAFVADGIDKETENFYKKKQYPAIWGDKAFKEIAYANALSWDREVGRKGAVQPVAMATVIKSVAEYYGIRESDIVMGKRGTGTPQLHRWVAMKLCQDLTGATLAEIANRFNVGNYCTVSQTISRLNKLTKEDEVLANTVITISKDLTP